MAQYGQTARSSGIVARVLSNQDEVDFLIQVEKKLLELFKEKQIQQLVTTTNLLMSYGE
jgi:hypothetical protein